MQEPKQRLGKLVKAAAGGAVITAMVAAPAMAVPNALERAAAKRAELKAEQERKAAEQQAAEQKAKESLSFDPFAPQANTPSAVPVGEAAKRVAARQNALARVAQFRRNLLIRLAQVQVDRRSPNTPPPFTDPRPSDPTRPGSNVAPGPE